jgi:tellurium resistance protein TerZ
MAVNLQKGQRISLDKESGTTLVTVAMGLGWDVASGPTIDLDASCILFDNDNQRTDVVWFRQLRSKDGSIVHSGDNVTGKGDGDDEVITVTLKGVPATVKSLVFTVNSFTGQKFSRVSNAFCRLVNKANNAEIARFDLAERGDHTALVMARLYRHNDEWKMHAIGQAAEGHTVEELIPVIQKLL